MAKRELILIRHTKASQGDLSLPDFDRPLKRDRLDDARKMAEKLSELGLRPELIICSPALRTMQTAKYFCEGLAYDFKKLYIEKKLYESTAGEIREVVGSTAPETRVVALIGHNPSLSQFAYFFLPNLIRELPTTGVVWMEFEKEDWSLNRSTPCRMIHFLTPDTI